MLWKSQRRTTAFAVLAVSLLWSFCTRSHAQVAVLMEEPYGFFGVLSPGGHSAIYLNRVCAETPLKLRRCMAGELGAVLTREPNMDGYDWIAIPLLPYLYSVENVSEIPARVDAKFVWRERNRYHESHLRELGPRITRSNIFKGGWDLLIGEAYERRIFAFRFETTPEQDDALIARLNSAKNRTRFHYLFNNCSDFTRKILNVYFPRKFSRSIFPDLGLSSPRHVTVRLVRYARKHPELGLRVFEIAQIPGYRRASRPNRTVIGALTTRGIAVPVALLNPYAAGGMLLDYLAEGRFRLVPDDAPVLVPDNLLAIRTPLLPTEIQDEPETTSSSPSPAADSAAGDIAANIPPSEETMRHQD